MTDNCLRAYLRQKVHIILLKPNDATEIFAHHSIAAIWDAQAVLQAKEY